MRQVCPHCGAPMYHKVCEYCGMPAKQPTASAGTKSRKFVWLAIALAAAVLLGVVGVTSVAVKRIHSGVSTVLAGKSENSTNDAAALKKMQDSGVFPSGTYLVGEEIPAGEYILVSESSETDHLFYAGIYADREKEQEISGGWNEFSVIVQLEEVRQRGNPSGSGRTGLDIREQAGGGNRQIRLTQTTKSRYPCAIRIQVVLACVEQATNG